MSEDDLYGGDIYGSAPMQMMAPHQGVHNQGGLGQGSMATVSQEKRTDDAQGRLKQAQITLETWQQSLADLIPSPSGRLDAETVRQEVQRLQAAEKDASALRTREAKLQTALAEKNLEFLELRWRLAAARETTNSSLAQARQLLTDPAVAREFERLRGVAEVKAQEVRKLQEELQAVNFSQESKAGRLLMAKCRALQDENEEMGRDLSEGHMHALERQLALAKAALEDMRRAYLQLEDVTQQLDNEAEDLQAQVFQLTHDLRWLESQQVRQAPEAFPANQRGLQHDGPPQRYGGRKYGGGPMKMGQMDNRGPRQMDNRRSGPSPSHDGPKRIRRS